MAIKEMSIKKDEDKTWLVGGTENTCFVLLSVFVYLTVSTHKQTTVSNSVESTSHLCNNVLVRTENSFLATNYVI